MTFSRLSVNLLKIKQSHYRPEQVLWVPEEWGSQFSRQSPHEGGNIVSPTHWPPLPLQFILLVLIPVRGWVDPRATVWPERLCQWIILILPSRIEPTTSRLLAKWLNKLGHRMPPFYYLFYVFYFVYVNMWPIQHAANGFSNFRLFLHISYSFKLANPTIAQYNSICAVLFRILSPKIIFYNHDLMRYLSL
jgi:hypothetical protein